MKLTEIHQSEYVYSSALADALMTWERWHDENPLALIDLAKKFPEYRTTQRKEAIDFIMNQLVDYSERSDQEFLKHLRKKVDVNIRPGISEAAETPWQA